MKYQKTSNSEIISYTVLCMMVGMSTPSFSQSSVQAFGVMDMGISHYSVSKGESLTALSESGNTTNRIGFRGSEDLGNGLKAIFWLEGGFNPSAPTSNFTFARRSVIGLTGSFGQITLGREYTPGYSMHSTFGGPFGTNGVADNILYRARVLSHDSNNAGQSAYVRSSNAITYISPVKNGIYGQFMYGFDEQISGKAGRYVGGRIGYMNNNFDVSAALNTVSAGENTPAPTARQIDNLGIGASYTFSNNKVMVLYIDDKIEMPGGDKTVTGLSIGLESKVGAGSIRAALGHVKFKYINDNSKATKYSLGYVHNLSKRTALYTSVAHIDNSNGASFVVNPGVAGKDNRSSSGIDFGVRHTF